MRVAGDGIEPGVRVLQTVGEGSFEPVASLNMRGAYPLENFKYLIDAPKKTTRICVRKSPFSQSKAKDNYETVVYTKVARNFKLKANRTADMFNARGFDLMYKTQRVL